MKNRILCGFLFVSALIANAQTTTPVTTTNGGTAGYVPLFSTSSNLENSPIIVTSSGNVGIGTTPSAGFDVMTPWINYAPSLVYRSASSLIFNAAGVDLAEGVTCGPCSFWMQARNFLNGAESVSINPLGGNVGIGTTAPGVSLDVVGPSGNAANLEGDSSNSFDIETGRAVGDQILYIGNDKQNHNSYIQSVEYGITTETLLLNARGGNVGIGTTSPGSTLEVNGNIALTSSKGGSIIFQDGSKQATAWTGSLCGGDYAESVDVSDNRKEYGPGDVLVIDSKAKGKFIKASSPYSTAAAGVYSTKPGVVGRRQTTEKSPDEIPLAVVGIVPTKASAENGPIEPGDLLVTATTPGYVMKGTDRSRLTGAIVGKAMDALSAGTGVIEVLISLQ